MKILTWLPFSNCRLYLKNMGWIWQVSPISCKVCEISPNPPENLIGKRIKNRNSEVKLTTNLDRHHLHHKRTSITMPAISFPLVTTSIEPYNLLKPISSISIINLFRCNTLPLHRSTNDLPSKHSSYVDITNSILQSYYYRNDFFSACHYIYSRM